MHVFKVKLIWLYKIFIFFVLNELEEKKRLRETTVSYGENQEGKREMRTYKFGRLSKEEHIRCNELAMATQPSRTSAQLSLIEQPKLAQAI